MSKIQTRQRKSDITKLSVTLQKHNSHSIHLRYLEVQAPMEQILGGASNVQRVGISAENKLSIIIESEND